MRAGKQISSAVHSGRNNVIHHKVQKTEHSKPQDNNVSHSEFTSLKKRVTDLYEPGHIIVNTRLCRDFGKHLKIMIMVLSAPDHVKARMAIRQTWGFFQRHDDIGIGFIVGVSIDESLNSAIKAEQDTYWDLIQSRAIDSYENVTLKTISMMEWVNVHCSLVPFILKCDDDMFINIPLLMTLVRKQQQAKRTIFGHLAHQWLPFRNISSKYFLSKSEYEADILPDFISGPAYLVTQDSVHDLYKQALEMTFFKLEDMFMTGFVASRIGVELIHLDEMIKPKNPHDICLIRETIGLHDVSPYEQFICWAKLHNPRKQCNKTKKDR